MLKMQSDAGGCDKATRDFLVSSFLPRLAFILLLYHSLFNGIIRRLQPVPSSFYLSYKGDILVYENMTSPARGTIKTNFIPR